MVAVVGVSANDGCHYLPPPLGGGGRFSYVLLLRLLASHPPQRPPLFWPKFCARLCALSVEQSALCGADHGSYSDFCCYGSCRFCHVLPLFQDLPMRHSFHSCSTDASFYVVCLIINQNIPVPVKCF